jgi:uncharacterized protein (TIGR02147 family)
MINLFEYLNYREFLRDFCTEKQKTNPHFSYRFLSQKIGLRSPGFLSWVIQGKRNISNQLIVKLARAMRMNSREAEYFDHLVRCNQAKDREEKQYEYEKLLSFRRGRIAQVTVDQYEFYEKWYYVALRELVAICSISDDYKTAALLLEPRIAPAEAKAGLELLMRLGMVRKNRKGVYERTDAVITSKGEVDPAAVHRFQIASMELAAGALSRISRNLRDISSCTLSVDEHAFLKINERIAALRAEVLELARGVEQPDRVMQLNIQLFPLSRIHGRVRS